MARTTLSLFGRPGRASPDPPSIYTKASQEREKRVERKGKESRSHLGSGLLIFLILGHSTHAMFKAFKIHELLIFGVGLFLNNNAVLDLTVLGIQSTWSIVSI